MLSKTGRFRRADRLLSTRDFRRAIQTGKRQASEHFVVVLARRPSLGAQSYRGGKNWENIADSRVRLGVTVSRRVGNAVVRNRVKRSIREWFRGARKTMPSGSDLIVIARETARGLSGPEASVALNRAVQARRSGSPQAPRTQ